MTPGNTTVWAQGPDRSRVALPPERARPLRPVWRLPDRHEPPPRSSARLLLRLRLQQQARAHGVPKPSAHAPGGPRTRGPRRRRYRVRSCRPRSGHRPGHRAHGGTAGSESATADRCRGRAPNHPRTEEGRLIEAVKQGQGLDLLVTALHATQPRREALERELTTLDSPHRELADRRHLRAALTRRAADVHGILIRREPEARRVLQALFNERLAFAPFNEGPTRGYQFFGAGSYGGLLVGDTCPTSHGGPNGIRTRV